MKYLLLIHIGPVQDFIASARRSRDLWFGSWLLSELSKAAAKAVVDRAGWDSLIFPAPTAETELEADSEFNVANKIVAEISTEPAELAAQIKAQVQARLQALWHHTQQRVGPLYNTAYADAQINDLLEFFWAASSLPDEASQYSAVRAKTEALLAARKMTRNFAPVTWGSEAPKSSLDGLRESVIPEEAYLNNEERRDEAIRRQKVEKLYQQYGVRAAERLSAVDLLKRHGQPAEALEKTSFPSTSHLAALPLLKKLEDNLAVAQEAWSKYFNLLPGKIVKQERVPPRLTHPVLNQIDGGLLFESRLAEILADMDKTILRNATRGLRRFLTTTNNQSGPLPYYALLQADGDKMGEAINRQDSPARHKALSQALSGFAAQVKEIVNQKHRGALVYAGGDDILAFLPLHTVLPCAMELANTFQAELNSFAEGSSRPTLSAGIVVSHHLDPLSDALALARTTERQAKNKAGRNALAVAVNMRSGVTRTVYGKWSATGRRLDQFIQFHRLEAIPDGAAYQIQDVALQLGGEELLRQPDNLTLQKILRHEGVRILARKRAERGTKKLADAVYAQLEALLLDDTIPVEQIIDELIISRLFARAYNQADIPLRND